MAYFEEGSEAMRALEAMVDKVGTRNVLYALAHISQAKANHIRENWQDATLAFQWEKQGCAISRFVTRAPQLQGNTRNDLLASDNGLFKRDRFKRACVPGANVRART